VPRSLPRGDVIAWPTSFTWLTGLHPCICRYACGELSEMAWRAQLTMRVLDRIILSNGLAPRKGCGDCSSRSETRWAGCKRAQQVPSSYRRQ
jgi:hypothetical protein